MNKKQSTTTLTTLADGQGKPLAIEKQESSPQGRTHASEKGARRFWLFLLVLGLVLLLSIVLGIGLGATSIPPDQVIASLLYHLSGGNVAPPQDLISDAIIWEIRAPRVLMGAIVGAALGVIGCVIQALVRNPLADPFLLGISSGASLGAVIVIIAGTTLLGIYTLPVGAFLGALLALVVVFLLAQRAGNLSPMRLVLVGVCISYVFSGATSFLIFRASRDSASSALFWLLGSLGEASWGSLTIPAIVLCVGLFLLTLQARALNTLLMGDEGATSLGIDVTRLRRYLLVVTALLTGVIVAISGGIGFVGLMIPHIVRMLVGSDHRRLLPLTALVGGIFLIWADVLARTLAPPSELPLGVVTSMIGAPFFLWLMQRSQHAFGGKA
jgi:iron complex transport system permease protein